jgi:hypothetical protein
MTVQAVASPSLRNRAAGLPEIDPGVAEFVIASFGICALLITQFMLSMHFSGNNYAGNDGALYQATLLQRWTSATHSTS